MSTSIPGVIAYYFIAQAGGDFDTIVSLFDDDAVLIDAGQTRHGIAQIREWRDTIATAYQYTTDVREVQLAADGTYVARVHLEGNFPGNHVDLHYRFTIDADRITRLEIAP
jgi:uncharacterized protein (TIGR02246 family)